MARHQRVRRDDLLLSAAVLVVLAVTLFPVGSNRAMGTHTCLLCGTRGLADAIRNTILFIPLGAAAALGRRSVVKATLLAVLVSVCVEIAQLLIPGRHATLGDLFFNTVGAVIGIAALRGAHAWVRPSASAARPLSLGATGLALLVVVTTGYLLQPQFPLSTYFGQWTPDLGHLEWYRGRVLEFTIGGEANDGGRRVRDSAATRRRLEAGATLSATAVAGPRTERLSSLVSIYDDRHREVVLLGADRDDLVYRYRTRSTALRLDQPDLRLRGAFAMLASGDTLRATVARDGSRYCMSVDRVRSCDLGFTAGEGWSLIYHSDRFPGWLVALLGIIWLAVLALPGAFWAPTRAHAAFHSAFLLGGLALAPLVTHYLPTTLFEYAVVGAAILAGIYLRRLVAGAGPGGPESGEARDDRPGTPVAVATESQEVGPKTRARLEL